MGPERADVAMNDNNERRRRRTMMVAAGLLIGLLLVTGCGARGETGAGASPTPTNVKAQAAKIWQEFVKCARKNGVPTLPDPKIESDGDADFGGFEDSVPASTRQKVEKACESILKKLPASGKETENGSVTAAQLAALRKFAACVRSHGLPDFPDPNAHGAFQLQREPAGGPKQMDKYIKPCKSLIDKVNAPLMLTAPKGSGGGN